MNGNVAKQVKRYPGNKYKSFRSLAEAQEWIGTPSTGTPNPHIQAEFSTGLLAPILPPDPGSSHIPTASKPAAPSEPPSGQAEAPPVTGESGVTLSLEQTLVLGMVKSGGNVFFTGSAGRFCDNNGGIQYLMSQGRASPCY